MGFNSAFKGLREWTKVNTILQYEDLKLRQLLEEFG
jgi:hypothetical protein